MISTVVEPVSVGLSTAASEFESLRVRLIVMEIKVSEDNSKLSELVLRLLERPNGQVQAELDSLRADHAKGRYSLGSLTLVGSYLQSLGNKETLSDYLVNPKAPSSLHFPKAPEPEPSEDLVKRREYLKLRAEAREYNRMIYGRDEDPRLAEIMDAGNHMSSARNQLAISANMVISVLASFAIAYYAGKSMKASATTSLVCGLLGAIAILFIEMTLFIVRAMRAETTTTRDARRVEASKHTSGLAPTALYTATAGPLNDAKPVIDKKND